MRQIYFITKKELTGYFFSPIAYVFICVFLLASMACTFYLGNFFASSEASLSIFFRFHPWLYLFLIPAVGMRLWAEERSKKIGNLRASTYFAYSHYRRRYW